MTGLSSPSYSTMRWWSKSEVIKQVYDSFADVLSFLQNLDSDLPRATSQKLVDILQGVEIKLFPSLQSTSLVPWPPPSFSWHAARLVAERHSAMVTDVLRFDGLSFKWTVPIFFGSINGQTWLTKNKGIVSQQKGPCRMTSSFNLPTIKQPSLFSVCSVEFIIILWSLCGI